MYLYVKVMVVMFENALCKTIDFSSELNSL